MITEISIAKKLVNRILADGHTITVNDGEAVVVTQSTTASEIIKSLQTSEYDSLWLHDADGKYIGSFVLIWGNDEDLISDYSYIEETREYMDEVFHAVIG